MARKKPKQKPPNRTGPSALGPGILLITACGIAAYIALSAPLLGLFYAGFSLVCVLLYQESNQRRAAQTETGFKIKTLEENSRFFTSENIRTREDIVAMQTRLKELEERKITAQKKAGKKPSAKTPPPAPRARKNVQDNFSGKFLTMLKRSTMPRAVKPGANIKPIKTVANDRSEDDLGLSDLVAEELVQHAIDQENINTFLQPVFRLPQRRIEYYEMFARIRARPGVYMPAARYLDIAHQGNMVTGIDTILLEESIRMIRGTAHMQNAAPFFMNITAQSLKDKDFMNMLLVFAARHRNLAGRLILEVRQEEFNTLTSPIKKIMRALGQLGLSFSLDNITDMMAIDETELQTLGIKFIKIRAATFLARAEKDTEFAQLRHTKKRLESAGVKVIAEKIEKENSLLDLNDYEISYGQGHALAKPDIQSVYESQQKALA